MCSAFEEGLSILWNTFINSVNPRVNYFILGSMVINVFPSNVVNLFPLQLNFPVLGELKTPLYFQHVLEFCFWLPEVSVPAVHCETFSATSSSFTGFCCDYQTTNDIAVKLWAVIWIALLFEPASYCCICLLSCLSMKWWLFTTQTHSYLHALIQSFAAHLSLCQPEPKVRAETGSKPLWPSQTCQRQAQLSCGASATWADSCRNSNIWNKAL